MPAIKTCSLMSLHTARHVLFMLIDRARLHQVFQRRQGSLGPWLSRQKLLWRSGKLSKSRISQLRALGVDIDCQTDVAGQPLETSFKPAEV